MNTDILTFKYEGQEIEFSLHEKNVMVNATEMAKAFGKDLFQFTKSSHAKAFIKSCLKPANAGFLGVENTYDLIDSRQKSGTWMHRVLALKFASWLDSDFELWVYRTIEEILFGPAKEATELNKKRSDLRNQIDVIHVKLSEENSDYKKMILLQKEFRSVSSSVAKSIKNQLNLFSNERELN